MKQIVTDLSFAEGPSMYMFSTALYSLELLCPALLNSSAGACTNDSACNSSAQSPTCVSWLPHCDFQYSCATEQEYLLSLSSNMTSFCPFPLPPPPTPTATCVPFNNTCQWYSPCHMWREVCSGEYYCGDIQEYVTFLSSSQPPKCASYDITESTSVPPGVCLYNNGQCEWSGNV